MFRALRVLSPQAVLLRRSFPFDGVYCLRCSCQRLHHQAIHGWHISRFSDGHVLIITWLFVVRKDKVETLPRVSGKERLKASGRAAWALGMPVIILGGIKAGIVTPTEAAVVAAMYALFVGMFIYRELKITDLGHVFLRAAKTTSVVMFLVCAALVSAWLITAANIPAEISSYIEPLIDRPTLLLFAIMILVLIVGTALDLTPTILILTPVLMPIIQKAGIDPVYFGVLFIMNTSIGLLTPPVGVVLNVVSGVGRVPLGRVIKGVFPFLLAEIFVLFLLVLFLISFLFPPAGSTEPLVFFHFL